MSKEDNILKKLIDLPEVDAYGLPFKKEWLEKNKELWVDRALEGTGWLDEYTKEQLIKNGLYDALYEELDIAFAQKGKDFQKILRGLFPALQNKLLVIKNMNNRFAQEDGSSFNNKKKLLKALEYYNKLRKKPTDGSKRMKAISAHKKVANRYGWTVGTTPRLLSKARLLIKQNSYQIPPLKLSFKK